jgi:hypothetical protein
MCDTAVVAFREIHLTMQLFSSRPAKGLRLIRFPGAEKGQPMFMDTGIATKTGGDTQILRNAPTNSDSYIRLQ